MVRVLGPALGLLVGGALAYMAGIYLWSHMPKEGVGQWAEISYLALIVFGGSISLASPVAAVLAVDKLSAQASGWEKPWMKWVGPTTLVALVACVATTILQARFDLLLRFWPALLIVASPLLVGRTGSFLWWYSRRAPEVRAGILRDARPKPQTKIEPREQGIRSAGPYKNAIDELLDGAIGSLGPLLYLGFGLLVFWGAISMVKWMWNNSLF